MVRRRTLRPEEEALWHAVARTAQPLHPQRKQVQPTPPAAKSDAIGQSAPPHPHAVVPAGLLQFRVGQKASPRSGHDLLKTLPEQIAAAPLKMDAKTFTRMGKGKLVPEARIDLHGMTVAEAHPELIRFLLNAHAAGLRLVLVITGKGSRSGPDHGPIPTRYGILKHQVPQWFRMAPLSGVILQVAEAHLRHGGTGAYYVYLRRQR
jgi:DNA-nicking Smr family endonuclease